MSPESKRRKKWATPTAFRSTCRRKNRALSKGAKCMDMDTHLVRARQALEARILCDFQRNTVLLPQFLQLCHNCAMESYGGGLNPGEVPGCDFKLQLRAL